MTKSEYSSRSTSLTKAGGNHGTAERWSHSTRVFEHTQVAGVLVARVLEENILDRLYLGGFITKIQLDAAMRFKRDYHDAAMGAHLSGSYSPTRSTFSVYSGWDERSDSEEKAYGRWRKAMRFLKGHLGDVVVTIICYEQEPTKQQAKLLRCGLKVLVKTYGLSEDINEAATR